MSKNGHKLPEILKIGSKIKVHQNENPLNPSYKHSKVHYWPILMVFRQKLWPQSHFGPGRRYPISPFKYFLTVPDMTLRHMMYEMSFHFEGFVTDTTDKLTSFPQMKILVVFLHLERGLEILVI